MKFESAYGSLSARGAEALQTSRSEASAKVDPTVSHAQSLRLEVDLPYRLNIVATVVGQSLAKIFEDRYGIGIPEWRVLANLGQYGTMTAKQIGLNSQMHKTKVSRAVAELERRRLISRRTNREDLREAFLSLTEEGRRVHDELAPIAVEFAESLCDGLSAHEQTTLARVLNHLIERTVDFASQPDERRNGVRLG